MKKTKVKKVTTGKKKSKKWIGIVVALFVVFGLFGGSEDTATEDVATQEAIVEESNEEVKEIEEIVETLVEEEATIEETVEEVVEKETEESEVISNLMEEPVEEVVEVDKSTPVPEPVAEVESEPQPSPEAAPAPEPEPQQQSTGGYAVNDKNGKIHIVGQCPATGSGDSAMEQPVYFNSYEDAEAYSIQYHSGQKKRQCGNCW